MPTKAVLPAAAPTDVYNVPLKVEETAASPNNAGDGGEVFYIFYESDDKKPKAPSQVSSHDTMGTHALLFLVLH